MKGKSSLRVLVTPIIAMLLLSMSIIFAWPPPTETHVADSMWIEPSSIFLSTADPAHTIGYRFNVTVYLNITTDSTFGYQIALLYNRTQLKATRVGFTAPPTSQFMQGHVSSTAVNIDESFLGNGSVLAAECLFGADFMPAPRCASLMWIELEVLMVPSYGESLISRIDISTHFPEHTWVWNPDFVHILDYTYDSTYTCVCGRVSHDPILILSDGDFTAENGVVSGIGTAIDPYVISGWIITGGDHGIRVADTTKHFVIRDNWVQNSTYEGIEVWYVNDDTCEVSNNIVRFAGSGGMAIISTDSAQIYGNNVQYSYYSGIYFWNSHLCNIYKNIVKYSNQQPAGAHGGIYIDYSSGNNVVENVCQNNSQVFAPGIWLIRGANANVVKRNIADFNLIGIQLDSECFGNTVENNTVKGNVWMGISVWRSEGNTISRNKVELNSNGIVVRNSSGNLVYHNNFIDNTAQVYTENSINIWDNGYPLGGNYWSNYAGVDLHSGPFQNETGSDGIGDTPYIICADDNIDRYPLMDPYTISNIYVEPATCTFYTNTTSVGGHFTISMEVADVRDLCAWEVELRFNSTLINVVNAWVPTADPTYVFYGMSTLPSEFIDNVMGRVLIGDFLFPLDQPTFSGSGLLAKIEFEIITVPPPNGRLSCILDINHEDTFLLDSGFNEILTTKADGYYEYVWTPSNVYVDPASCIFYTNTTLVGDHFNISVKVTDVIDMAAWQVELFFDPTRIEVAGVWIPRTDPTYVFYGRSTLQGGPSINNVTGTMLIAEMLFPVEPPTFSGDGLLVIIEFEIMTAPPPNGGLSCILDIDNDDTYLLNYSGSEIPTIKTNGFFEYLWHPYSHLGDLIVDGTQTFVIENCTFAQTGSIYMEDEATLIIRNGELQLNQTERFQHSLCLTNHARLLIDNGTITSSYCFRAIEARNNAEIQIDRWNKSDVSASVYIAAYDSVNVTIKNSNMSNWLFYKEYLWYLIHFLDNSIGYIVNSTIDRLYAGYATKIDVLNSTIVMCEAGSGYDIYNNELSTTHSHILFLGIGFLEANVTVVGLKPGQFGFWNSYQNFTMNNGPNVTLIDTRVDIWSLSAFNSELRIKESLLSGVEACFYWSKVFIEGSTIAQVEIYCSDDTFLFLKDSTISYLVSGWSNATIGLSNVTVLESFRMLGSDIYMYGNSTFKDTVEVYWYDESVLKRNFGVICLDQSGNPIADAELMLYDVNASKVWDGITDSYGCASFNLTFTSNNYTDSFRLEALNQDFYFIFNVSVISDTPIILSKTRNFCVTKNQTIYTVITFSNSSITDFEYDETLSQISFKATGPSGTVGFINMTVPKDLGDAFEVLVDGVAISYIQTENSTHYFIYFEFTFSTHEITIRYAITDIAITNVTPSKTTVGQGYSVSINVTVENQGNTTETINVTIYYNDIIIILPDGKNYTAITLTSGDSTTLTFTWNTTGVAKGNYTITAKATHLPTETDTTDNTLTDGTVIVTIPGDVDGDFDVDLYDAVAVCAKYGFKKGHPEYDPNCDINNNDQIFLYDAVIVGAHYGQKHP